MLASCYDVFFTPFPAWLPNECYHSSFRTDPVRACVCVCAVCGQACACSKYVGRCALQSNVRTKPPRPIKSDLRHSPAGSSHRISFSLGRFLSSSAPSYKPTMIHRLFRPVIGELWCHLFNFICMHVRRRTCNGWFIILQECTLQRRGLWECVACKGATIHRANLQFYALNWTLTGYAGLEMTTSIVKVLLDACTIASGVEV